MADVSLFAECQEVTDDSQVRQGDVFEWLGNVEDPWKRLGVVVTADCDIVLEKHRGILSYIPILSITDYLRLFHLPKLLTTSLGPLVEQLIARIRAYQAKNVPEFPEPLSDEAVLEWVRCHTPDDIATELRVGNPTDRAVLIDLMNNYLLVLRAIGSEPFEQQLDRLAKTKATQSSITAEQARDKFWKELAGHFKKLPDDCFFIGCIGTRYPDGHVAYLRLVREIQHDAIAIKQSELAKALTRRIARLQSPYVYRLTQLLGNVFASIGLPTEYEDNRKNVIETLPTTAGHSA